jgi:hypothetical protein
LCKYLNKSASRFDKFNQSLSKTTKASSFIRDIKRSSSPNKSVKSSEEVIKESLIVDGLRKSLSGISKDNSLEVFDEHLRKIMVPYLKPSSNENHWNPNTDIRKSPVKSPTKKNLVSQSSSSLKKKLAFENDLFTKSLNDVEKQFKKEIINDFDKINKKGGKEYKVWKQSKDDMIKSKYLKQVRFKHIELYIYYLLYIINIIII